MVCRTLLLLTLLLIMFSAKAGGPDGPNEIQCPNRGRLVGICNAIAAAKKDQDQNSPYVYQYQRMVYEASCVDVEIDDEEAISRKVGNLWRSYPADLTCNMPSFNVVNGSVLKLAASKGLIDVLEDAAQVWKIDLNAVDRADGRTLLDYVRDEIKRNDGSGLQEPLEQYYGLLRRSGAKHRSEL